ncbi:ASKHA domain-containing protein [Paenibacillus albidus]|nr:ASKHA domain-containing protein [Paenibacillus albidus]
MDLQLEDLDVDEVVRQLGYENDIKNPNPRMTELLELIQARWNEISGICIPKAICNKEAVKAIKEQGLELMNGSILESKVLASRLKDAEDVIYVIITLGSEFGDYSNDQYSSGGSLDGLIIDTIGNVVLEQVLRQVWEALALDCIEAGQGISRSLSPGTFDFKLEEQKLIFDRINAISIGVELQDFGLMKPLKTVSLLYGAGRRVSFHNYSGICESCSNVNCNTRKIDGIELHTGMIEVTLVHPEQGFVRCEVKKGSNLLNALIQEEMDIPSDCGGRGTCGKCKVRVLTAMEISDWDSRHFHEGELDSGYRLACRHEVNSQTAVYVPSYDSRMDAATDGARSDLLEIGWNYVSSCELDLGLLHVQKDIGDYWEACRNTLQLSDLKPTVSALRNISALIRENKNKIRFVIWDHKVQKVQVQEIERLGIAIDLGTTTIAVYLLNIDTGEELGVISDVNKQRKFGADVITRLQFCADEMHGSGKMAALIVEQLEQMIDDIVKTKELLMEQVDYITISGNTSMIHLLLMLDTSSLLRHPFRPVIMDAININSSEIGFKKIHAAITILPAVSIFVGGDITAGIWASEIFKGTKPELFIDLGTNGEIVLGSADKLYACATAVGPAFEGAHISCGIGGVPGAIRRVTFEPSAQFETIGNQPPVGICGSGVIELTNQLLMRGIILGSGRLDYSKRDEHFPMEKDENGNIILHLQSQMEGKHPVYFTQEDIREIQLAKAAVRSGITLLLQEAGLNVKDIHKVYLAGGFGNQIDIRSAINIGLLPEELEDKVVPVGNTSGVGAKAVLLSGKPMQEMARFVRNVEYVDLSASVDFQEIFVYELSFANQ